MRMTGIHIRLYMSIDMHKCAFGTYQQRPRSDCADAQSDLGLHCLLTEFLDTEEYIIYNKCAYQIAWLRQQILIFTVPEYLKDTFFCGVAHTFIFLLHTGYVNFR